MEAIQISRNTLAIRRPHRDGPYYLLIAEYDGRTYRLGLAEIAALPEVKALVETCQELLEAFEGYEMMAALDHRVQDLAISALAPFEEE